MTLQSETYTLEDVAETCPMDAFRLAERIRHHGLAKPDAGRNGSFDAATFFFLKKAAKIFCQNLTPEVEEQKIAQLARNRKNSVTISDVAALAGVSIGSVSRVFSTDKVNIKENTRKKVLAAATRLGYRPNPFASALRSRKSGIIGAVIRDLSSQFLQRVIDQIQTVCTERGLDLLMSHARHEKLATERQIKLMMNQFFDGMIILGDMEGDETLMEQLSHANQPVVSVDSCRSGFVSTVQFDDEKGAQLAFDHLYDLGHRRIAYVGNVNHTAVRERLEVYRRRVRLRRLGSKDELVFPAANLNESMQQGARIAAMKNPPTAVVCSVDPIAWGVINALWQQGLRVPEDISVIGFNDAAGFDDAYHLTTIRQPVEETAVLTINELERQLQARNEAARVTPVSIILEPDLVIRQSCAPPRG